MIEFIIGIIILILVMIRMLMANQTTFIHRVGIIYYAYEYANINNIDKFWEYHSDFKSVSYNQHFIAVATFRNPWKLYRYGDEYKNAVDK